MRAARLARGNALHTVKRRYIMKVLILGVNGFIGHHLTRRILEDTNWEVFGMCHAWRAPRFLTE